MQYFRLHNLDADSKDVVSLTGQRIGFFRKPYTQWVFVPKDGLMLEIPLLHELVESLDLINQGRGDEL